VLGGGLVGPLTAIYLAKRGFDVKLHERRGDLRAGALSAGRSINLAVTARGLKALDPVGLRGKVLSIAIPMKGRMIHDTEGKTNFQPYSQNEGEVIYAASRGLLNRLLIEEAANCKNLEIAFDAVCTGYDFANGTLKFDGREIDAPFVIGADGAWSSLRKSMLDQVQNFNYSQSFLEYGYKELVIPADEAGNFRMEKNALHIWPRKAYMLIALPNTDGSFTCTLFYPYHGPEGFNNIRTPQQARAIFERDFADALAMMPTFEEDFFGNPTGALVTVKCSPWHAQKENGGKALLIGDAAHAIVPFFGQGMNCGFEDCAVLGELLDAAGSSPADSIDWAALGAKFESRRKPNADAIAEMALENFVEMRDSVADPKFLLKKKVGFELEKRFPGKFIPRYAMVVFHPEISYAEAQEKGRWQEGVLERLCSKIDAPEQVDWKQAEKLLQERAA
jgi:kynurenine 3-monooxygenase